MLLDHSFDYYLNHDYTTHNYILLLSFSAGVIGMWYTIIRINWIAAKAFITLPYNGLGYFRSRNVFKTSDG